MKNFKTISLMFPLYKDKNTVETVQKAIELFQTDNSKYLEN